MTAAELLSDLTTLGIQLEARGERLRYWPRSAATPDLVARLQAHKGELLAMLTEVEGPEVSIGVDVPRDVIPCGGCGHRSFIAVTIHGGQSTRRDCAQCHRTVTFPIWYGRAI